MSVPYKNPNEDWGTQYSQTVYGQDLQNFDILNPGSFDTDYEGDVFFDDNGNGPPSLPPVYDKSLEELLKRDELKSVSPPEKKSINPAVMLGVGQVSSSIGNIFQSLGSGGDGPQAHLKQAGDAAFDAASDAMMSINPLIGGIMKAGGMVSDILTSVGGMGTDNMTKTDAILGSKLLSLTPFGMINGWGGKNADSMTKNEEAFAQVGASYGGSSALVDDAMSKQGKKYGLFSSGDRQKANAEIAEGKRQQAVIENIAEDAKDRFSILTSMSAINSNRRALELNGGYDLDAVRVGKQGMKIQKDMTFEEYISDYNPDFYNPDTLYDLELAFKTIPIERMLLHKDAINKIGSKYPYIYNKDGEVDWDTMNEKYGKNPDYIEYIDKSGDMPNHLTSVALLEDGNYVFLKLGTEKENPSVLYELNTYYDGSNGLKDTHDVVFKNGRYYYIKNDDILLPSEGDDSLNRDDLKDSIENMFPVLRTIHDKYYLYNDPNYKVDNINIEYITQGDSFIDYGNLVIYDKPQEYLNLSVVVFNNNVTYRDIVLDVLSHGLREHDPIYNKLINEFEIELLQQPKPTRFVRSEFWDGYKVNPYWNSRNATDATVRALLVNEFFPDNTEGYWKGSSEDWLKTGRAKKLWNDIKAYITQGKTIKKFREGGSFNVIPEGALHARLHHMDVDNITKKGIPVVAETINRELEQQAEIENSEIIYRLQVTEKLEELCKMYYDENTSQSDKDDLAFLAGKLLVYETLYNTIDNTLKLL